jgi:hypothetical protein
MNHPQADLERAGVGGGGDEAVRNIIASSVGGGPPQLARSRQPLRAEAPYGGGVIDWMFRNRRTGALTVAQLPNASLGVFLVATAVRLLASPHGGLRTAINLIVTVALLVWAADEVIRGVNPFRRLLGGAVLAAVAIGLLR